jgi:hypothetical protein
MPAPDRTASSAKNDARPVSISDWITVARIIRLNAFIAFRVPKVVANESTNEKLSHASYERQLEHLGRFQAAASHRAWMVSAERSAPQSHSIKYLPL